MAEADVNAHTHTHLDLFAVVVWLLGFWYRTGHLEDSETRKAVGREFGSRYNIIGIKHWTSHSH